MDDSSWWELLRDLEMGKLSAGYVHKKLLDYVEKTTADRERWKERCLLIEQIESLKNMVSLCHESMSDKYFHETENEVIELYKKWQKLKSEMEAGDE